MADAIKDGGPAFPHPEPRDLMLSTVASGMTLRDWFAGQALAWAGSNEWHHRSPEHLASRAYLMADAMLAAREATP